MSKLQTKLVAQLERNPAITIQHSTTWELPVVSFEVAFRRVKRYRLDILMRMILHVVDEMTVRRAVAIADLLVVEELFIEDLLTKLMRNGLIKDTGKRLLLTSEGKKQLLAGIYEEEQEEEFLGLLFSPNHKTFIPLVEEVDRIEEASTPFRLMTKLDSLVLDEKALLEGVMLTIADQKEHEEGFVESVEALTDYDDGEIQWVTCYEFRLYDEKEKVTYVRVWNPLLSSWDATLEAIIEEIEAPSWK